MFDLISDGEIKGYFRESPQLTAAHAVAYHQRTRTLKDVVEWLEPNADIGYADHLVTIVIDKTEWDSLKAEAEKVG